MTVRELIGALSALDPDLPVILSYPEWPYLDRLEDGDVHVDSLVEMDSEIGGRFLHEAKMFPGVEPFRACVIG